MFLIVNTSLGTRTSTSPVHLYLSMASIHSPVVSSSPTTSYHAQDIIADELMLSLNPFFTIKPLESSQSVCRQKPNHTIIVPSPTRKSEFLRKIAHIWL